MANAASLPEGYVLAGKYLLKSVIGHGGMGEVWLAEQLVLKALVAVKVIHTERQLQDDVLQRFKREAEAAAHLRSAHVVQILDFGVDEGTKAPFMVMELLQGESLARRIQNLGRLEPKETALVMRHVARAVGKAHEAGIVHRDLKPENVFLTYADDELVAKVLDFGIAKFQHPAGDIREASTKTGAILGTPFYMSPEQAEGTRGVDFHADIWAMGVIAFECLTGQRAFDGEHLGEVLLKICAKPMPVPSLIAPVPTGFDDWFARAANRDVSQRFQSARDAAKALDAVCSGNQTMAMEQYTGLQAGHGGPAPTPDPGALGQSNVAYAHTGEPAHQLAESGGPLAQSGGPLAQSGGPVVPLGQTGGPLARTLQPRQGPSPVLLAAAIGAGLLLFIGAPTAGWLLLKNRGAPSVASSAAPDPGVPIGTPDPPLPPPPAETAKEPTPPEPTPAETAAADTPPTASAAATPTKTKIPTKTAPTTPTTKPPATGGTGVKKKEDLL